MKYFCFAVTLFFVRTLFASSQFIWGSAGSTKAQLCSFSENEIQCVPIQEQVMKDSLKTLPSAQEIARSPTLYVDTDQANDVLGKMPTRYCAYSFEYLSSKPGNLMRYALAWINFHNNLTEHSFSTLTIDPNRKSKEILKNVREEECDVAIFSRKARY